LLNECDASDSNVSIVLIYFKWLVKSIDNDDWHHFIENNHNKRYIIQQIIEILKILTSSVENLYLSNTMLKISKWKSK